MSAEPKNWRKETAAKFTLQRTSDSNAVLIRIPPRLQKTILHALSAIEITIKIASKKRTGDRAKFPISGLFVPP